MGIALIAIVLVGLAVYLYERNKKNQKNKLASAAPGGQSAFSKIADASVKEKEAQGKIEAIHAAAEAKTVAAADLKEAALDAHEHLDEAHNALDEVHAILGK